MIILTIISIIIFVIIYYYLFLTNTEKYVNNLNNDVYFMMKYEISEFLRKDKDNYINNMSDMDLHARKVKSKIDYINNIVKCVCDITDKEKDLLMKCCRNADNYLENCNIYSKYINYKDLVNIKWVVACTYKNQNLQYEEGLPHTRENIIFISKSVLNYSETDLTNTMIHEKIHIYQRYNKDVFDKLIYTNGYKKIDYNNKFIRSNPDTNNDIYLDNKTKNIMVCLYRNSKPNSINDVIMKNFSLEHPYEKYAYEIANNYYKDTKYKNI